MIGVAELLEEHRCEGTIVLDIGAVSDVADYFVIATVRSSAHLHGVYRYLLAYLKAVGLLPLHGHKRIRDDRWILVDCGSVVIHLMEEQAREFYELEKLWFNGRQVFHSSKSS